MPSDLATAAGRPVIVRDSAGLGLPFSKGLMATSILATGAETDQAYAIAAEIQRELTGRACSNIDAHELATLAATIIEARAGAEVAARYQTWRRLRREGRPLLLVLGGAPGVGKSTISTRLAVRFGITRIVTTDTIREVLRTVIPATVLPELHVSTYESVGAGADPAEVYVRQARGQRSLDQFQTIRSLHDLLAARARSAGVEALDLGAPRRLTERVLELVHARAAPTP